MVKDIYWVVPHRNYLVFIFYFSGHHRILSFSPCIDDDDDDDNDDDDDDGPVWEKFKSATKGSMPYSILHVAVPWLLLIWLLAPFM